MKSKTSKKKLMPKGILFTKKKSGFIYPLKVMTKGAKKSTRRDIFTKKVKQYNYNEEDEKNSVRKIISQTKNEKDEKNSVRKIISKTKNEKDEKNSVRKIISKTKKQNNPIQMKSDDNRFGNTEMSIYGKKKKSWKMVDTNSNVGIHGHNHKNSDKHISFLIAQELNNDKFHFVQYRTLCEQYIALRIHINKKSKMLKKALNILRNEYDLLTCRMNIKYHVNRKFIYFMAVAHYLKKLKCILSLFTEFIKTEDEDLLVDLYRKLKKNMRLLFYVGRIVSNYATCIAYVRFLHDIVLSIFKIDKCLCELTALEPFKTIIPQLLNAMHIINNSINN